MLTSAKLQTSLFTTNRNKSLMKMLNMLIHWCTCEIDSYKIMFLPPYSVTKLFEFQEGYITSAMTSVDMCEILHVLWEQDKKSLNFLELYVEVIGNSFVQCISHRNCCLPRV